ncbi:MAG: hypothetical protein HZA32_16805 [Opitutae bacterium]|nr:hypothetical protein [Opitutae bacterium]
MTVLDIDLDAFVQPAVANRREGDPRPDDGDHTVSSVGEVSEYLHKWHVTPKTPLLRCELHDGVLAPVAALIGNGVLSPPLRWVHVDAHDDLYGHYSRKTTSANFMYEVIRRKWPSEIVWAYPPNHDQGPPGYVFDWRTREICFEDYRAPFRAVPLAELTLPDAPAFAFLCRSPSFSPPKADALFDYIVSCFAVAEVS